MKCYTFEDDGQDFLQWYINDEGIVVDCQPSQGRTWVGMKIVPDEYVKGDHLKFVRGGFLKHKIKSIRILKKKEIVEVGGYYKDWKKIQAAG